MTQKRLEEIKQRVHESLNSEEFGLREMLEILDEVDRLTNLRTQDFEKLQKTENLLKSTHNIIKELLIDNENIYLYDLRPINKILIEHFKE